MSLCLSGHGSRPRSGPLGVSAQASMAGEAGEERRPSGKHGERCGRRTAGAGIYNVDTAEARSMNANTAMQVNQYMYEVNQTTHSITTPLGGEAEADRPDRQSDVQPAPRQSQRLRHPQRGRPERGPRRVDQPPGVYPGRPGGHPADRQPARQEHRVRVCREHDHDQPGDLSASGVPDVLADEPEFEAERQAVRAQVAKAKKELESQGQVSPETLANAAWRSRPCTTRSTACCRRGHETGPRPTTS